MKEIREVRQEKKRFLPLLLPEGGQEPACRDGRGAPDNGVLQSLHAVSHREENFLRSIMTIQSWRKA